MGKLFKNDIHPIPFSAKVWNMKLIFNTKYFVASPLHFFSLHICTKKNAYEYYKLCISWCFAKVWNLIRKSKKIVICWFIQQDITVFGVQNTGIHVSWTITLVLQHAIIDSFHMNFWLACGVTIRFSHLLLFFNVFYYCWDDCLLSRGKKGDVGIQLEFTVQLSPLLAMHL